MYYLTPYQIKIWVIDSARGLVYHWAERILGAAFIVPMIDADDQKRLLPDPQVIYRDPEAVKKLTPEEQEEFDAFLVVQSKEIRNYSGCFESATGMKG